MNKIDKEILYNNKIMLIMKNYYVYLRICNYKKIDDGLKMFVNLIFQKSRFILYFVFFFLRQVH